MALDNLSTPEQGENGKNNISSHQETTSKNLGEVTSVPHYTEVRENLDDETGREKVLYRLPNGIEYRTLESGNPESKNLIVSLHGIIPGPSVFYHQQKNEGFQENTMQIAPVFYPHKYDPQYQGQEKLYTSENYKQIFNIYLHNLIILLKEKYNIKKVHLEGVSAGGIRVANYAAQYPENVASILLSGSSGYNETMPEVKFNKRQLFINSIKFLKNKKEGNPLLREYVLSMFGDQEQIPGEVVEYAMKVGADMIAGKTAWKQIKNVIGNPDIKASDQVFSTISQAKIPVTMINGEEDDITPAEGQEKIYKKLREQNDSNMIKCYSIPGKHAPYLDNPDEYNYLRKQHLDAYTNWEE